MRRSRLIVLVWAGLLTLTHADLPLRVPTSDGFSYLIPDGWLTMPAAVMAEKEKWYVEHKGRKPPYTCYALQRRNAENRWFVDPCLVIEAYRTEKVLEPAQHDDDGQRQMLQRLLGNAEKLYGMPRVTARYDWKAHVAWGECSAAATKPDSPWVLVAVVLTERGKLHVAATATAAQIAAVRPVFQQVVNGIALDEATRYKAAAAGDARVVPQPSGAPANPTTRPPAGSPAAGTR